jgi:hypothetical protein
MTPREYALKLPPDVLMHPMPFPSRLDYAEKIIKEAQSEVRIATMEEVTKLRLINICLKSKIICYKMAIAALQGALAAAWKVKKIKPLCRKPKIAISAEELINAAKHADWFQVVSNTGPPCFHFERERQRFCLRAERWMGHHVNKPDHKFVPLDCLLVSMITGVL